MEAIEISNNIFSLVKNNILLKLRFLEIMIYRLEPVGNLLIQFGTDGQYIYYNPIFLINYFKEYKVNTSRLYMHTCFHALLKNPFMANLKDDKFWDVACDICVETILDEFDIESLDRPGKDIRVNIVNEMKNEIPYIQPDFVYQYLKSNPQNLDYLKEIFEVDDHSVWLGRINCKQKGNCGNEGETNNSDESTNKSSSLGAGDTDSSSNLDKDGNFSNSEKMWTEISNRLMIEITHFSKEIGVESGAFMSQLGAVTKEKYDYEAFLKKFAVLQEAPKLNVDEFDMIFYTYGLDTYGNMPLIEPLEYKDVLLIRDFVIAIDTSGSVVGETVKRFLIKTYNILETTNSFGKSFNLFIIQCDTEVQHSIKITNKKEFDNYINNCTLYGFGGTDFRPVFNYVDELINKKEFVNLKGLIYFTDGYGIFPAKKTRYKTCFVFVDKTDYDSVEVPVWSTKLFLDNEDI